MAAYKSSPLPEVDEQLRGRIVLGLLLLIVFGVGVTLYYKWRSPPQIGTDPSVFKTVDALYTAVRSKDAERLTQCETRLRDAHAAGTLPNHAWDELNGIIATARAEEWQTATQTLYDFMLGQRRE